MAPIETRNPAHIVHFARGGRSLAKCKSKRLSLLEFVEQFTEAKLRRTPETHAEFFGLPKDKQDELKNANGWFIGGPTKDGRRGRSSIQERRVLLFDCDEITKSQLHHVRSGASAFADVEFTLPRLGNIRMRIRVFGSWSTWPGR